MMRNLKVLGIALVAVFAMSAVAASMASADSFKSDSNKTVNLTATQATTNVLKTTAGSAECKVATFTATSTSPVTTITAAPTYSSCTCIGIACTVNTNGCTYLLHIGAATTGTADLVCPAGKEITLESTKCIVHVPPQTGLGTITYSNIGTGTTKEVSLSIAINSAIKYTHTKVAEGIGTCTSGSGTTGSLNGTVTVTATEDPGSAHVGIFVE